MLLGMTDVSVIVPTFNRPELLARALESLAAQTLDASRFEVLVVNDCGLDPGAVVSEFSSPSRDEADVFTDPRITRIPRTLEEEP